MPTKIANTLAFPARFESRTPRPNGTKLTLRFDEPTDLSELSTRLRVERIAYPQPAMLSPKRASNTRSAAKAIATPKKDANPIIWRTMSQKHHLGSTLARTTATVKTRYPATRARKTIRKVAMKPLFVDRASYSEGELAAM